ncbi:hypothetical protein DWV69_11930 [Clostridium sp. AF12-19]|nr:MULTISPECIES: hypothetical protein [unclassified Clostridium]RHS22761.1 hypothetical protein DWV71_12565 [Clostridium sp. AF12-28]RHS26408.1 hypothetical protein DWV69_11930 [Clostridium sp. AF12-19]
MKHGKYWIFVAAAGAAMVLSACSAGFVSVDNGNESRPDGGKTESIGTEFVEKETSKPEYQPLSEEERRTIVDTLEAFDPDHLYVDMDPEQAASCGGELRDAYDFIGRETDAGAGYVLGFRNSDEDPLNGLSIYSLDDVIEADRWNEKKNIFERVYTFENIHEMHYTESKDILFLIPDEMEESEELRKAFEYSLCDGDEGVRYLKSVKERGVKMSPPENGGYLVVRRFANAEVLEEYILLTEDQEKEIITSEEIVDPEIYGIDGITYMASPEIYELENPDPDEITVPALRLAKEKCEFQTVRAEDMKEITSAELEIIQWHGEPEKYADVSAGDLEETGISETLNDPVLLKRMEEILAEASLGESEKCPYNGILTLTKADGTKATVRLASDGCDSMVYGSYSFYQADGGEVAEIWDMFPELKKEIMQ